MNKEQNSDNLSIGKILKAAREKSGMTIEEVSAKLKIKRKDISALEQDSINILTASHFYISGFIRSYANLVKIDKKLIERKIKELLITSNVDNKKHKLVNLDQEEIKTPSREIFYKSILLLIILYIVLIIFYQLRGENPITTKSIISELNRIE